MLTSDHSILDVGNHPEGIKVERGFAVYNKTDEVIKIIGGNSSCGCTIPVMPTGDLKPGNHVNVSFSFNTKNRKGYQKKSVFVFYEKDGKKTTFTQDFKCNVL